MSYDISLIREVEVEDVGNMTYNTTPMFTTALGKRLRDFSGLEAGEALRELRAGLHVMIENPDEYKAMNPSNGWGNYEGAVAYLSKLVRACEANPDTIIRVY